jgi:hypothetical protein
VDKKLYRQRREMGLRGQGDKPQTVVYNNELSKPASSRPRGVRRRVYRAGKPTLPTYNPQETNHMRALKRKAEREGK